MASVHVVLCTVQGRALTGAALPLASSVPIGAQTVEVSGISAQAGLVAEAAGLVWVLTAVGGAAWAAFGPDPEAAAGAGWLIPQGPPVYLAVTNAGERCAVIAAA